jgi:Zn-dependent protease
VLFIIVGLVFKHVPGLNEGGGNSFLFFRLLCLNLIQINCILGIFNLIPVPPLDGHWILFRYLPSRWAAVLSAARPYGFLILIALLWSGILGRIIMAPLGFMVNGLVGIVRLAVATL